MTSGTKGTMPGRGSALCVLTVGTLVLTACGGNDEEVDAEEVFEEAGAGAMEGFSAGDTFEASEPVEFSVLYRDHPNYPVQNDWRFLEHLEEEHNVTLNTENAPLSDWEERRSLVIGAGDAPDFIPAIWPGDETQYVAGGAILPVSDYLDLMPHFTEKVEEWELEEEINGLRQDDGRFYLLPGLMEEPHPENTLAIRGDIWDELGYDDPETWEEFAEQLRGVQEAYPDMVPFSDRWSEGGPLEASLNIAAASYDTSAGWGFGDGMHWDEDAGEFVYAGVQDEYRELLEYFHGLVDEGLMDSESITQDDDQAIQKFASGQSAVISTNHQEIEVLRSSIEGVGSEEMDVRLMSLPGGPAGDMLGGSRIANGIVLSSDVADEDYFVALLQFLDWLYYSDEGLEYAKWGIEGETFERDGDERVLAENIDTQGLNPEAEEDLAADYGFSNGVFMLYHGSTLGLSQSMLRDEVVEWQESLVEMEPAPVAPGRPLDELEREQASIVQTQLSDTVQTATAQFILGQRDFDEWDSYVAELESAGLQDFVETQNEAYERGQEALEEVDDELSDEE